MMSKKNHLVPLAVAHEYAYYILYGDPSALSDEEVEMVDNYVHELPERGAQICPQMTFEYISTGSFSNKLGRCDICGKLSNITEVVAVYSEVKSEIQS